MDMTITWSLPILMLPGVALLILSTSTRFGQLHSELHYIERAAEVVTEQFRNHLLQRAVLFRNALVSLYISVALLTIGSITGVVVESLGSSAEWVIIGFTGIGIICLIWAAVQLVAEARLSLKIIDYHLANINAE